jgi:hypothetical protein
MKTRSEETTPNRNNPTRNRTGNFRTIMRWIHEKCGLCQKCHRNRATWVYMPNGRTACDRCVPRGCNCNMEPKDGDYENEAPSNWDEPRDKYGRKHPCCEWEPIQQPTHAPQTHALNRL